MRVALCQISSTPDPAANLTQVRAQVASAAADGARVVLFPEATMANFAVPLGPVAEPLDGPWATAVRQIADEAGVVVVAGMFTPSPDGRVLNTLLVTGQGHHLGYDKIHLFDAFGFQESRTVAPGTEVVTFDHDGVTFGLATCYDVRFPELFRALADKGASVILLGASWGAGPGKQEQWDLLVRARALDSTSWVLAAGQADPGPLEGNTPLGIGYSTVATPRGEVVEQLAGAPGVILVDVDPAESDTVRAAIPVLANRRL
ncbi:carbon-nitrogen hydrolase family protein [Actinokineospora globicatena]|uniref:Apolipoprotein acyltransferase n=1 Tax=Actinokineospora globicatena TaxID=103729 RepID=A0A9W6QM71_9PSEU|nr:carbon-nitrogen hydrolase family protein [Actinokineospora globicatena]MCP2304377.1 putative amidohydrolase [Actinokineospora globicatena]GLW78258.1 apolipoprotein acyltransferase [Actinokineospora globicatena]GLW85076.1 apolipoprotein acyltransferase [Actinokineospora globicatena]GLW90868.1 apolipoprotein acyltransferase [Actinokineospora globicatena]